MKRSRFTEGQIAYALRPAEGGTPVADVCRRIGISGALQGPRSLPKVNPPTTASEACGAANGCFLARPGTHRFGQEQPFASDR